jgi:prephenate dehydratase
VTRVGYLGPRGTFAEEALNTQPDLAAGEPVPLRSVPNVLTAVEEGEVDIGLVPIENSIEGTVTVTLDTLAFDTDLLVQREIDLPVSLHLCAKPGTRLDDVRTVISHPNPLGQSRGWLAAKLPEAELVAANSTADAAQQVAATPGAEVASIGTLRGAELVGLEVLASEVEDHPNPSGPPSQQRAQWVPSPLHQPHCILETPGSHARHRPAVRSFSRSAS